MVSWTNSFPAASNPIFASAVVIPAHRIRSCNRGRPVADKITPGQLSQSLVARQWAGLRHPFVEQRKGLLFSTSRAKADQPILRRPCEKMVAALASRGDVGLLQELKHFITGELLAALQGFGKHLFASSNDRFVQLKLAIAAGAPCNHPWGEQCQHPTHVVRGNKMQGAAHRPGADNGSLGNRLFDVSLGRTGHTQPNRPKRAAVVLGLHRAQPGDDITWLGKRCGGDALICQPSKRNSTVVRWLRLRHRLVLATQARQHRFVVDR